MAAEPFLIAVLTDVIRSLNERGVDYALTGGLTYGALVEPRATTDVDLLILLDNPSVGKIDGLFSSVFDSIVPYPTPMAFKRIPIWRTVGVRGRPEIIVDLLLARSDFLREALARKRTVAFLGLALPIVTLENLVILKALAGRLQDLADLEKIGQRPGLQVDWNYVGVAREVGAGAYPGYEVAEVIRVNDSSVVCARDGFLKLRRGAISRRSGGTSGV